MQGDKISFSDRLDYHLPKNHYEKKKLHLAKIVPVKMSSVLIEHK